MNKQEVVKVQACVLRVNIHCDGCKKKVKKLLQGTEGVYTVTIDSEQGKVTVTGGVDPDKLIKKLEKSGKHAELWGGAASKNTASSFNFNNQFKNLALGNNGKSDKTEKNKLSSNVGKDQSKQQQIVKEMIKDMKSSKEQKNVKFNLPKESKFEESSDGYDDEFSDDDEYDDDDGLDDDDDDGYGRAHSHDKKGSVVNSKESKKASKESGKDKKNDGKKGGGGFDIPSFMKGLGLKSGKSKTEGKKKKNGGDGDGKDKKDCKHGDKKKSNDGGGKNKGEDNKGSKKGGGKSTNDQHDGFHLPNHNKGFDEFNRITNLKGSGGGGGGYMGQMGQMGHFPMGQMGGIPAVQGLPAMNGGGYYQNPIPQQYMNMNPNMNPNMMNHHQHQGYVHGNDMFHPMMYGRPNQPTGYVPPMPPPVADPYVHMFSDENASGCIIM